MAMIRVNDKRQVARTKTEAKAQGNTRGLSDSPAAVEGGAVQPIVVAHTQNRRCVVSQEQKLEQEPSPEASKPPQERPHPEEWDVPGTHYNCFNCNAMCCSLYERVAVNEDDIQRLCAHFGLSRRTFLQVYTHRSGTEILLNRVPDGLLEETCVFLNQETRLCGVHEARPEVCQVWPPAETSGRCVYYDVLQFERSFQGDPNLVIKVEVRVSPNAGG
jgi:Fe-S-cluster containining protein